MQIVVAMSGGVDSSVAAALLVDQGHDVIGVSVQLYDVYVQPEGRASLRRGNSWPAPSSRSATVQRTRCATTPAAAAFPSPTSRTARKSASSPTTTTRHLSSGARPTPTATASSSTSEATSSGATPASI